MYRLSNPNISKVKPENRHLNLITPPPPPPYLSHLEEGMGMKTQHLSLWHLVGCRFASVLLLLLFFAVLPHSKIKAQTIPQHEFSINISDASATEGNSDNSIVATVTLSVSNPTSLNFSAGALLCFTGTATEGTDYTLIASNTMDRITLITDRDQGASCDTRQRYIILSSTIPSWSFRIQVNGDRTIESDEAIIISITTFSADTREQRSKIGISPTAGSVTFTIEDDDSPTANFATASSSADEDEGTVTVAVNLSENATMNTDVAYSVSGTAASAMDFTALSGTVQIASGTKTANISIPIIDDMADEPDETIILTLNNRLGYKVGTPNVHTLTINDDDATPKITSLATASVAENTTTVLTVTATDTDDNDDDLTYSITAGADSAQFSLDQDTQALAFKTAPDFEAPRSADNDNVYEIEVTASDGTNNITQTITITVTDVNEPPMLAPTITKSIAENTTIVLTVTATDADTGTTLTYAITAGIDSARFNIDQSTGDLTFKAAPDFETPGDQGGDNDYEVIVTASDGTNSASQTITVTVTDVNEAPVIAAQTFSVTENTAAGTTVGTVAATDEDAGDNLIFSITSGNVGTAFVINENTGVITVAGTIDHETTPTHTLTVQVSDGSLSATAVVTINVTNVNDNDPMITSPASASVVEGTTAVLTITATDADGNELTYSISGGADRALFSINRTSGALTLITAPDFEAPGSADNSNVYEVEVMASDGSNSDTQTITVTVTDNPTDNILSFSEAEEEVTVIFPNPSGDYLEVRSSAEGVFQLLSLSGKPLLKGTTNTRIDITSLQSGLYLVQLPDGRLLRFVRE